MNGCQDYHVTRRAMMGASAATIMGFSIRDLLAAKGRDHAPTAENVILFWNGGGMTHLDTWDPKPGRPTQGEFEPISTSADGVRISEIFTALRIPELGCLASIPTFSITIPLA